VLIQLSNLQAQGMAPRELATAAWALGRLAAPNDQWLLDDITCYSHLQLRRHAFDARQLAMLIYGLALRRQNLPLKWLQDYEAASAAQLPMAGGQTLVNVAWALVKLGHMPGDSWREQFFASSLPLLPQLQAIELEQLLWALSRSRQLASSAPAEWLSALVDCLPAHLHQLQPYCFGTLMICLAKRGLAPSQQLLDAMVDRAVQETTGLEPVDAIRLLSGLAQLGAAPDPATLQQLLKPCETTLHKVPHYELPFLALALAELGHVPSPGVLLSLQDCLGWHEGVLPLPQQVQVLWALARLRAQPTPLALQSFFNSTGRLLGRRGAGAGRGVTAGLLADAAWGLSALQVQPPPAWLAAWRRRLAAAAEQLVPEELAVVLSCCCSLGCADSAWLDSLLEPASSSGALSGCEAHVLVDVLQALQQLRYAPSEAVWEGLSGAVASAMLTCDAGMQDALRAARDEIGGRRTVAVVQAD
jgi:hypothetical protein